MNSANENLTGVVKHYIHSPGLQKLAIRGLGCFLIFISLVLFMPRLRTEYRITASPRKRYRQQQASFLQYFTKMHVSRAARDFCGRPSIRKCWFAPTPLQYVISEDWQMTSSKSMSITEQSLHWFDGMWHLSAPATCSSSSLHLLRDGPSWESVGSPLALNSPNLTQELELLLFLLGLQGSLPQLSLPWAARETRGAAAPLLSDPDISLQGPVSIEKGRRSPKHSHLPCSAPSTFLLLRARGSQEKAWGEFARHPFSYPHPHHSGHKEELVLVYLASTINVEPAPVACYVTEHVQGCKTQGEMGKGKQAGTWGRA